uniref:Putative membrane protein C16E9.09c n=1 Tax=Lygus hesperus TaxID=30085 RepID=A0A0A9YQG5_LYGHE
MDFTKISIGKLEGKSNWSTWKFKVELLFRKIPDGPAVVDGTLKKPIELQGAASEAERRAHQAELNRFDKADSDALLILSSTMKDEILHKILRFKTAREAWLELHRLYDGVSEDKAYDLCSQFFNYKKDPEDDVASHMSKLKNIWNELKLEVSKDKQNELPELFLLCKVLETLPQEYFPFK